MGNLDGVCVQEIGQLANVILLQGLRGVNSVRVECITLRNSFLGAQEFDVLQIFGDDK